MANVYGIDLGTTYSAIATLDSNGMPVIIPNHVDGSNLLASAVFFEEGASTPVIGEMAKAQKDVEPDRVVEATKRFIGKKDAPDYEFDGVKYNPITISSLILKRMKEYAEEQGHEVRDVVITCPAYFGQEERAATMQAGQIAGLNVLNIVNEPSAAAMNYCCREFKENRRIMVYDLGGGTFDITLFDFSVDEEGKTDINVIDSSGDNRLGGIDWDARMFEYMCEKYADENGMAREEMEREQEQMIKAQCEQAKKDLTTLEKKRITINVDGDRTSLTLTREEYEQRTRDLVERTMSFVSNLLNENNLSEDSVNLVLLVGGSTKMPMIKKAVEAMFPGRVRVEDPDLAVAKGAALAAAIKWNEVVAKIKKGEKTDVEITAPQGEEEMEPINVPGTLTGTKDKLTRSVGPGIIVTNDRYNDRYMIDNLLFVGDEVNSEAESIYGTRVANQPAITVRVFENTSRDREDKYVEPPIDAQGNEQPSDPNLMAKMIGVVRLVLPPNTPAGYPIRVSFSSTTAGLKVTATDITENKEAETIITSENTMSQEELDEAKTRFSGIKTSGELAE